MPLLQEIVYKIEAKADQLTDIQNRNDETILEKFNLDELIKINIDYFRESYLNAFDRSTHFVDKTPGAEATHGWKLMKACFPGSAILCCYRSPVEVIESSLKKFYLIPNASDLYPKAVKDIASGWVAAMQGIHQLLQSPFANDAILINQLELRKDPSAVLSKVFGFLGAPQESTQAAIRICRESRDDVLTSAISLDSYKQLSSLDLESSLEASVREICSETCNTFGIPL